MTKEKLKAPTFNKMMEILNFTKPVSQNLHSETGMNVIESDNMPQGKHHPDTITVDSNNHGDLYGKKRKTQMGYTEKKLNAVLNTIKKEI